MEYDSFDGVMQAEDFFFCRNDQMLDSAKLYAEGGPDYSISINSNLKEHGFYEEFILYAIDKMGYDADIKRESVYYTVEYTVMDGAWKEGKIDVIQVYLLTAIYPWENSANTKSIEFSLATSLKDAAADDAAIIPPENLQDYQLLGEE